jgi:hypothetical protein
MVVHAFRFNHSTLFIFAHNSLAATAVAAGMSFYTALIDALPEKFKRREVLVKERARLF